MRRRIRRMEGVGSKVRIPDKRASQGRDKGDASVGSVGEDGQGLQVHMAHLHSDVLDLFFPTIPGARMTWPIHPP